MEPVADLAEEKHLRDLASGDVLDAGTKLAEEGAVSLGKFGPLEVAASVEDGPKRTRYDC